MATTARAATPFSSTDPVSPGALRLLRFRRQGLDGSLAGASAATVLERTGWVRSVGGATPYLALHGRAGLSREAVDGAVARLEVQELPAVRGCTYVVPAADFGLALLAGQGSGEEAEVAQAKRYCGVTDAELDTLSDVVLSALSRAELDPAGLKEAAGGAVRSLGPEGKRRGLSSTLPLVLGRLQAHGEIRRVPVNGRLDQQRYRYARWSPSPMPAVRLSDAEVAVALARRFFRWSPGATVEQLAWWGGLGVKAARQAVAELGLAPLAPGDARLAFADDAESLRTHAPSPAPALALVGLLDNLLHLRREVASLLDPEDAALTVPGPKGRAPAGQLSELSHHAIVDRGRVVGLWDWDGVAGEAVHATFRSAPEGLSEALAEVSRFVRDELGDLRTFSLDSPEGRKERLAFLRSPGW